MKISELINHIRSLDIKLWLENDHLRYDAPSGALTDEMRAEIVQRKDEVIEFLRSAQNAKHSDQTPIETVQRDQTIPLSFAQQRLWFLHQLMPASYHYNLLRTLSLKGPLNVVALEQSLNKIVQRHEALRTHFEKIHGQPVQRINTKMELTMALEDLSSIKPGDREHQAIQIAKNEYLVPFDLNKGPLFRARLLRLDNEYHWLLLSIHHIVSDAWSLGVLVHELSSLYEAYSKDQQSTLPEPSIQYADYTVWQREWLSKEILENQLGYWRHRLACHSILHLPTDRPRPAVQTLNGGHEPLEISQDLTISLKKLSRSEDVTLFMTLLSAFYILLYRYSGQDDILVGSPIANRNRSEIEGLIGFFVNTLPLRGDLSGKPSFRGLLTRVRKMVLEAYEHQDLPFEKLVEELQPQRDLSRNPLFQVMFALQNAPADRFDLPGLSVNTIPVENVTAKFDLLLSLEESGNRLRGTFEYNSDIYDLETIRRMIGHYNKVLEGIVEYPDLPVSDLNLLSDEEREIIVKDWNRTERDYPTGLTVHKMFEQQAERTPEAVALIFEEQQMTYRRINEAANGLAWRLRELGVCPDEPVGIMMERSLEMVLAVLGVLKAGGAYVPMDPTYPAERLSFILQDTKAKVLLTQKDLSNLLPSYEHHVLYLDGMASKPATRGKEITDNRVSQKNMAYLIYTSGSTGKPKGIMMGHGALCNLINWQLENTTVNASARTLQFASLGFDVSFQEIFSTWCAGGTLVLIPELLRCDIIGLLRFMERMSVERIFVPFVVLQNMAEVAATHNLIPGDLHEIITAGEQLQLTPSIREFMSKLDSCILTNQYGPSEAHVVTSYNLEGDPEHWPKLPPIGRPISNVQIYILDKDLNPVPVGIPGELYIGGRSLARGYLNRPELTNDRFVDNPFDHMPGARLYRSGDMARYLPDGSIEFLGRIDNQVKIRGFRIELGEIESVLVQHPSVKETVVIAREDVPGDKKLVAYVVPSEAESPSAEILRDYLKNKLPDYMVPSIFMMLDALPVTANRKVDRKMLPVPLRNRQTEKTYIPVQTETQKRIAKVWQNVLNLEKVGIKDNFFELGGHSLSLVQVHSKLVETFGYDISVVDLFQYPTIESLAGHISNDNEKELPVIQTGTKKDVPSCISSREIAIIGIAGHFPGAGDTEQFWSNIRDGMESIRFFTDEELLEAGIDPVLLSDPSYVKASGYYEGADKFDPYFFGYTPREAELMDPQQRLFLECAWEALENAGYVPSSGGPRIGVYAGSSMNSYIVNLRSNPELLKAVGGLQALISGDKDFMATRVSYKLNLSGPSINVQTACSTSLVAIHEACKSLLNDECDMALAGGVRVSVPVKSGYLYHEHGIMSPDGHCRAFDANARGTVIGNGVGVVVLKPFAKAMSDGDFIYAVIKGSAINNDGSSKVGYTAPSVEGQAEVIRSAQITAGVDPRTIDYIETHGTGTSLGDPIEVTALNCAFGNIPDKGFCALGSVKTNIGHLDAAAGVASLIKTAMALKHKQLPPSLHFISPNPQIDFDSGPFYVNKSLLSWPERESPRRAGVSSFGIGGTNAHVILEEAPEQLSSKQSRPYKLLMLSAKSPSALEKATSNLAAYLHCHEELNLADVAYTLQIGRKEFAYRRFIICRDRSEAFAALEGNAPHLVFDGKAETDNRQVIFLFSGQGSQYPDMGKDLYINEPAFRSEMEKCSQLVRKSLGLDLLELIYPPEGKKSLASERLKQTSITQPALFALEYSLANLWMSWGIRPHGMLGHSIGEYVAACLSGVFTLEDTLDLVCERGRLMGELPGGSMLAVEMPVQDLSELIRQPLSIAVINGPELCVVSGPDQAIAEFEARLTERGLTSRRLHTSHAFHSQMMDPITETFTNKVRSLSMCKPKIPFISNVTGTWITDTDLSDPSYWSRHLRKSVRFSEGLSQLLTKSDLLLLEVGPGNTLCSLARRHPDGPSAESILSSIRHPKVSVSDDSFLMESLGRLWLSGADADWSGFYFNERRHRVPLPTYPFERERYWIDTKREIPASMNKASEKRPISDWFYIPSWKRSPLPAASLSTSSSWLLFMDSCGLGDAIAESLREQGLEVVCVRAGRSFIKDSDDNFHVSQDSPDDYKRLLQEMKHNGRLPSRIIHMWNVSEDKEPEWNKELSDRYQQTGFYSLLYLAQALGEAELDDNLILTIVSSHLQDVNGKETLCPEKSLLLGPCRVIDQEYQNIRCVSIDVEMSQSGLWDKGLIERLLSECQGTGNDPAVAYRGNYRWIGSYEQLRLDASDMTPSRLREHGVYLITGGLGGIGSELAAYLARKVHAKLVLLSRKELPQREGWDRWLGNHDKQDLISLRIKKIQSLESLGAEVMTFSAEVEDEVRMESIIREILSRFGRINGVIHSAGIPGGGVIQSKDPESAARVLRSKVIGTRVLERVLSGLNLDFMVFCSSLASIMGGMGQVDYCAANSFLDSFARYSTLNCKKFTISVNWNAWKETGMAVDTSVPDYMKPDRKDRLQRFGISNEEGIEIFSRIVDRCNEPQVAISKEDLGKLLEEKKRIKQQGIKASKGKQIKQNNSISMGSHPRPHLSTEYVQPRNETEQIIANIWQGQLGIDRVGIHDNFFELGGDSLSAIQVISKAREAKLKFTPAQIFKHQTIAELALQLNNDREISSIVDSPKSPNEVTDVNKPSDLSATTLSQKDLDIITKRMMQSKKDKNE